MKRKSVLPFAVVLGIAAVWTMFTKGGSKPFTVNMKPLGGSSTQTTVTVTAPSSPDPNEESISALFQSEAMESTLQVHAVRCEENICTVEAFAPGDPGLLRSKMEELVRANPWLGRWELRSETENPGIFKLTFYPG